MKQEYITIGLGLLLVFLVYKLLRGTGEAIGIIDTKEEEREEKQAQTLKESNYFTPEFYKQKPGALILTFAGARDIIKRLEKASGVLTEDERTILDEFKNLKTKSQISFLSYVYRRDKNRSLLSFLDANLNDSEMAELYRITNKKPNFKP